jgi:uroporphyrin-III C-methyltransferase
MKGTVYLVGAGPGDPELLTLKAARLLRTADAVLHDDLVAPEVLRHVPSTAQVHNVGKRCGTRQIRQEQINFLMIALAEAGLQVVRLKGGDPMIFGRAGEEIESLRRANIPYEVVPGITSALGTAASVGFSLTHRDISSAVVLTTFHQASNHDDADWSRLVSSNATLVIYMPGRDYDAVSHRLTAAGLDPATPCLVVSRATTPDEQTHATAVRDLAQAPKLPAPTLLIVGEVTRLANIREDALAPALGHYIQQAANQPSLEEPAA